jgi:hypothetical protein
MPAPFTPAASVRSADDAHMEFQAGGVRMDLDNCHLAVVLIDVLVECDQPWLIRIDEA